MLVDIGEVKKHIKPKADSTLRNMRKDDLIEYIRTLEHNYNVAVSFNENQARYIESLGVLPIWIPVTERLPEKGEIVLACGKRHATSGMFQGTLRNNPKLWYWKGNTLKEVTHWMPLPEPPKEGE